MQRIGIIGGMSWESTAEYLRSLNQGVRERLGGLHSARLVVATVDFAAVEPLQVAGRWGEAGDLLAAEARGLEAAGADLLLIATNTMHRVFDAVAGAVSVPVLHLADVTAVAVRAAGLSRVGLLATRYTMEQDFYRARLAEGGVTTIVPGEADREEVQRIVFEELCVGRVEDASRRRLLAVAAGLVAAGAEGIVLGCTELELSVGPDDAHGLAVPVFPTTALHCRAALDLALGG
ncbi:aspartate/glutamate racemase family protein [Kineococcus radiotolerans]|uniref:Aspartate racemase n=1 Tax=Kineococcus radiotolerans (strain ATCC BAA-149 / DSM 14245 / SRS30216) TaxID=266940 RepID=A6WFE6_KINRD|nr:aspartate/glutamate racemase family protein [Kineococcus radiotolerans]ABS05535.1 aspartate racemase [Kineococcus radiotolerans SRS30216 = ATCC BAA-149]